MAGILDQVRLNAVNVTAPRPFNQVEPLQNVLRNMQQDILTREKMAQQQEQNAMLQDYRNSQLANEQQRMGLVDARARDKLAQQQGQYDIKNQQFIDELGYRKDQDSIANKFKRDQLATNKELELKRLDRQSATKDNRSSSRKDAEWYANEATPAERAVYDKFKGSKGNKDKVTAVKDIRNILNTNEVFEDLNPTVKANIVTATSQLSKLYPEVDKNVLAEQVLSGVSPGWFGDSFNIEDVNRNLEIIRNLNNPNSLLGVR